MRVDMDSLSIRDLSPPSTSMAMLQQPTTFVQWMSALRRVKVLYLRGLTKQCSDRCNVLLYESKQPVRKKLTPHTVKLRKLTANQPHPLHATYLYFYSALSIEGMARSTRNLSALKIPTLKLAKAAYEAAASSLPAAEYATDDDLFRDSDALTERSMSTFDASRKIFSPSLSRSSSHVRSSSASSMISNYSTDDYQDVEKPSPLCINKPTSSHPTPTGGINEQPTPVSRTIPSSPASASRPSSITFSASASAWLKSRARDRYNAHLISFAEMLTAHIEVVNNLIRSAEDIQNNRHTAKRIISPLADDEARAEDRRARIAKLRERCWQRERFSADRYMDLCAKALSELSAR